MGNPDSIEKTTIGELSFLLSARSGSEFFKITKSPSPDMTKYILNNNFLTILKNQIIKNLLKNDYVGVTKYEATSKGYFTPAGHDPDNVQRIRNGDSLTEAEILYADSCVFFIACASFFK